MGDDSEKIVTSLLKEGRGTIRFLTLASVSLLVAGTFSKPPSAAHAVAELEEIERLMSRLEETWPLAAERLQAREWIPAGGLPATVQAELNGEIQTWELNGRSWVLSRQEETASYMLRVDPHRALFESTNRRETLGEFFDFWDALAQPFVAIVPGELSDRAILHTVEPDDRPPRIVAANPGDEKEGGYLPFTLFTPEELAATSSLLGRPVGATYRTAVLFSADARKGPEGWTTQLVSVPCSIVHTQEVSGLQAAVVERVGSPLPTGRSATVFPALGRLPGDYRDLPLSSLRVVLGQRARESSGSVRIAGVDVPLDSIATSGTTLVVLLQLVFFLQVRFWRAQEIPGGLLERAAWLGAYPYRVSRACFFLGAFALPPVSLGVTVGALSRDIQTLELGIGSTVVALSLAIAYRSYRLWRIVFSRDSSHRSADP